MIDHDSINFSSHGASDAPFESQERALSNEPPFESQLDDLVQSLRRQLKYLFNSEQRGTRRLIAGTAKRANATPPTTRTVAADGAARRSTTAPTTTARSAIASAGIARRRRSAASRAPSRERALRVGSLYGNRVARYVPVFVRALGASDPEVVVGGFRRQGA